MGDISRVIYKDGNTKHKDYDQIEDYIYSSRVIGNTKWKAHVFLTVQTNYNVPQLIQKQIELIKN